VEAPDAKLVEGFPKKSIAMDKGEEVLGLLECCIIQLFLESCQPMSVKSDFHG